MRFIRESGSGCFLHSLYALGLLGNSQHITLEIAEDEEVDEEAPRTSPQYSQ